MTTPSTAAADPALQPAADTGAGRWVWLDLMTTDRDAALAFYTALFDWTVKDWAMPNMQYKMVGPDEQHILGGVVPLDPAQGLPSHWIGYLAVPDVAAACTQATALGGTVHVPETPIPTVGRFAVVADPGGAYFSPFRGDGTMPPAPAVPPNGTLAWMELSTPDVERAAAFYAALTGWTVEKRDMGPMGFYYLFQRAGVNVSGMMTSPGPDVPPYWMPYFAVASADAAAARVTAHGGRLIVPPMDIEQWGRFCIAMDPTGAAFAVLENKQPM